MPCHTVLGWSGLCWTDVTFHLPRQCTCNWLPRRSLTSDVVIVAVVAALTQFSVALRCVVFWATHLTQLRATTTTTRGVQRQEACRGVGSAAAAALTFITDSDAVSDCNPNTSAPLPIPSLTFHPLVKTLYANIRGVLPIQTRGCLECVGDNATQKLF